MAYSEELRQRAVAAYEQGAGTRGIIARLFQVGTATLGRWIRRRRETGEVCKSARGGGWKPRIDERGLTVVAELVRRQNDATLRELCELYAARTGTTVTVHQMFLATRRLGLTRKKRVYAPRNKSGQQCKSAAAGSGDGRHRWRAAASSSSTNRVVR